MFSKINSFFQQSLRVWHVLRKPSNEEFTTVAKVSAVGILVVGFVGFLVSIIVGIFK